MIMSNQLTLEDFKDKELNPNSTPLEVLEFIAQVALQKLENKENAEANSLAEENAQPLKNNKKGKSSTTIKEIKENSKRKLNNLEIPTEEWVKQFTDKKKREDSSNAPLPPRLPEEYKRHIIQKCGGSRPNRIIRIYQKTLYGTDVSKQHSRLTMSLNKAKSFEFLKEDEITLLRHKGAIKVPLIHKPRENDRVSLPLIETTLTFKLWKLHVEDESHPNINYQYVLNGGWNNIVSQDKLEKGDTVHVWAFRDIQNKLCMAIVKSE